MIQIGVGRKDINPSLDVPHAGWGAQTHIFADGIESDLYTTALYLTDGTTNSILIDIDACLYLIDQSNQVREAVAEATGLPFEQIRLSVTHAHSGPIFWSDYYKSAEAARQKYFQLMLTQTVEAALEAKHNRVAVTVESGVGACHVGVNRRQRLDSGRVITGANAAGPMDPDVGVVRFEDAEGAVVATIVHYSAHPTTLGYTYKLHSPDYPGVVKRVVEQLSGGTCLFLQGATGNVGPGPEGFLSNLTATQRIGTIIGAEAVKVSLELGANALQHEFVGVTESGASLGIFNTTKPMKEQSIRTLHTHISLPLRELTPLDEAKATYTRLAEELDRLQTGGGSAEEISAVSFQMKRAFLNWDTSRKYNGMTHTDIEVQVLRIGDMVLIGTPLEPFVEIGLHIKAHSPFRVTLFSGYSNGHLGYLPIAEAYAQGGYEVITSPFAQGAAELFMEKMTELLNRL
ncbi:neutral/alkaline non-lysosomal ceramidase N-terminal domain-containing protein [Paenibacillus sp. HJGM_3]|uniref:neutral/alkaline non-lysosomal ceramidase N-terminal domain-containing protein n=1 Tax=Paenibacillus sp. HJGM_3 TaxID=3379816 RepID=UPI00385EDB98